MAFQQFRTVRLAMVFGIVILTVFLYASYYTNPIVPVITKQHTIPSSSLSNAQLIGTNDATSSGGSSSSNSFNINNGKTSNLSSTNISKNDTNNNNNNNNNVKQDTQQISDKETNGTIAQIYTDTIVSSSAAAAAPAAAAGQSPSSNSQNSSINKETLSKSNSNSIKEIRSSDQMGTSGSIKSNTSSIQSVAVLSSVASHTAGQLDPTKGIRTSEIYEPGHSEASTDICIEMGEQVRLLILITSAPTHREARLAIRQTWGHYGTRRDVSIGFVLGSTQNSALEDQLAAENYMYGDLIRGYFVDSYNNLTLKTISMLEWVDTYCPQASFILKTDDDMFINVPKLLQFIEKHSKDKRHIYGRLAKKWKPIRNKKSKYYVSPNQYLPKYFPDFTTGPAYLMTSDVIHDLYLKSLNQTYLKLEDVYTTGIVAEMVKVKRLHVGEFLNRRIAFNACNIKKSVSVHMVKSMEQFDLWKKLMDIGIKCK